MNSEDMGNCCKCGSKDVLTGYVHDGECCDSSSDYEINNEFIYSTEYSYFYKLTAVKEHLYKVCRNCQYKWRENTKDSLKDKENNK